MRNNWARSKSGGSAIKRTATEISTEDPEVDDNPADNKPAPKGTTAAHFIKFMSELLNVMDLDETFKGSYVVMDNASIHKSKSMLRKIESKGYKVMYLPPYSPELNPIEQFWAIVKGKMKCDRLMSEENLSSRIGDACNDVLISDLYSFCSHSKRQIIMWTHIERRESNRGERPTKTGNKNTSTTAMVIPCGNYQTIL
ncbi:hypothetical protein G6F52_009738 [Rhizopus delemar]|nr:hypothetical protein G6F52_009738 [Rhizopus delemar]